MPKPPNGIARNAEEPDSVANALADIVCGLPEDERQALMDVLQDVEGWPTDLQSLSKSDFQERALRKVSEFLEAESLLQPNRLELLTNVIGKARMYVVDTEREARALAAFMKEFPYEEQLELVRLFRRTKVPGWYLHTLNSTRELHNRTITKLGRYVIERGLLNAVQEPTRTFMRAIENVIRVEKDAKVRRMARDFKGFELLSPPGAELSAWQSTEDQHWQSEIHQLVMQDVAEISDNLAEAIRIYYEQDAKLKGIQKRFGISTATAHVRLSKAKRAYGALYLKRTGKTLPALRNPAHEQWQKNALQELVCEFEHAQPELATVIRTYYVNNAGLEGIMAELNVANHGAQELLDAAKTAFTEFYADLCIEFATG